MMRGRGRRGWWLWPICICALGSSGCSWLFVDRAPEAHADMPYFECTSSRVAPVIDTVVAATYGLSGTAVLALGEEESATEVSVASLVVAGVAAGSAIYGYGATSECADARAALVSRTLERRRAQQARPRGGSVGCTRDVECKGDRICERGLCVAPLPPPGQAGPGTAPVNAAPPAGTSPPAAPAPGSGAAANPGTSVPAPGQPGPGAPTR